VEITFARYFTKTTGQINFFARTSFPPSSHFSKLFRESLLKINVAKFNVSHKFLYQTSRSLEDYFANLSKAFYVGLLA